MYAVAEIFTLYFCGACSRAMVAIPGKTDNRYCIKPYSDSSFYIRVDEPSRLLIEHFVASNVM
jgi:hypothetical protein